MVLIETPLWGVWETNQLETTMNTDEIKYFNAACTEYLQMHFGAENVVNFFVSGSGLYKPFLEEDEQYDGSMGATYVMEFYAYLKADVIWDDADADFFGTEMIRKHSPFYAARCCCEHDCCGHSYTANIDIYHRHTVTNRQHGNDEDVVKIYKFVCLVHNGRNL